eukprot:jgi/Mesvir1/3530/Mv25306-RA.1
MVEFKIESRMMPEARSTERSVEKPERIMESISNKPPQTGKILMNRGELICNEISITLPLH